MLYLYLDRDPANDAMVAEFYRYLLCRFSKEETTEASPCVPKSSGGGHSLALRIPKSLAIEVKLDEETEVDLAVTNGTLVVAPATKPGQTLGISSPA